MKAVSDAFRLWLSLRPAQRVGGVISCFWVGIFLVILMVDLTTLGTLAPRTFTWIAVVHGALVSRGILTFFLYPGLVPRLPGAVARGLIQGTVEILIMAVVLVVLATWARMVGLADVSPVSDFFRLLVWSGLSGLGVYLGLRFLNNETAKSVLFTFGVVGGILEFQHLNSAHLITALVVVGLVMASPPVSLVALNHACAAVPQKTPHSGFLNWFCDLNRERWALFPTRSSIPASMLITVLTLFLAMSTVVAVGWLLEGLDFYWFTVAAISAIPTIQMAIPRDVTFPGLMGFSRRRWAHQHLWFRARLWVAWGVAIICCVLVFEFLDGIGTGTPMQWLAGTGSLVAWAVVLSCLLGMARVLRYAYLTPFHLQFPENRSFNWQTAKALGWRHSYLALLFVMGLFFTVPIVFLSLYLNDSWNAAPTNFWEIPIPSGLLIALVLLAIASWVWSFRLQYRAILKRDLV